MSAESQVDPLIEDAGWFREPQPYFCPSCWERFGLGSVMNIDTVMTEDGDPVLGPGHALRFWPRAFDESGVALSPSGQPSYDMACPHCRRKLPVGYCDTPHHIFSLVGAPGAGKSYYLSVLINVLQKTLFNKFGVIFRDEDPAGNVLLNEMKNQIFSAVTREEAILDKTTWNLIIVIAVLDSTTVFRLTRAVALNVVVMDYVEAARLRGEGLGWVMSREILPNIMPPLIAEFGLRFCFVFLTIAALSFLGFGIQPPLADWGSMVRENASLIQFAQFDLKAGLTPLIPAAAIALLTIAVNFIVDWFLHKTSGLK
ncbi:MAG: ABC transporter permease subunit, partial [Verrucomicrobiota bacterium]